MNQVVQNFAVLASEASWFATPFQIGVSIRDGEPIRLAVEQTEP